MAGPGADVETLLRSLQHLVREDAVGKPQDIASSGEVPEDLRRDGFESMALLPDEQRGLVRLRGALGRDLRFEHLRNNEVRDATWRFVCEAVAEPSEDHVKGFVERYGRKLLVRTCFIPVDLLSVTEEFEFQGVRILPAAKSNIPARVVGMDQPPSSGALIAVEVRGASYDKMGKRARLVAERALRLLRIGLRAEHFMPDPQLRFRLAASIWFDDGAGGWEMSPESGWDLELDRELLERVERQQIARLPQEPTTDVERRAERALSWFERAQLATDSVLELLFLFFALEAVLGDKSEGLKAPALALRRAILGLATSGGFIHPARTYLLYDKVRSAAVHGEGAPEVSRGELQRFAWDVRQAINEFLKYAQERELTKRAQVRNALDADERRDKVARNLLAQDAKLWGRYLNRD